VDGLVFWGRACCVQLLNHDLKPTTSSRQTNRYIWVIFLTYPKDIKSNSEFGALSNFIWFQRVSKELMLYYRNVSFMVKVLFLLIGQWRKFLVIARMLTEAITWGSTKSRTCSCSDTCLSIESSHFMPRHQKMGLSLNFPSQITT
jgi:hypothetical protein